MFQTFIKVGRLLIVGLTFVLILPFSTVAQAQDSSLQVELTRLDNSMESVPFGSDVTYIIKVSNVDTFDQPIDTISLALSITDTNGESVILETSIGTLNASEFFETEYTLENAVSTITLTASAMGSLVNEGGSGGTVYIPEAGSDSITTIVEPPAPISIGGVGTPGYWKNHHDVWAHLPTIFIGDYDMNGLCDSGENCLELSNEDALFLLNARNYKEGKDKRYTLYRSLTAAWLNIIADNEYSCIEESVDMAILWLQGYGNPLEDIRDGVKGNEVKGKYWSGNGNELYKALDIYNNIGSGCAIDRDSGDIAAATGGFTEEQYAMYKFGQLPVAYLPIVSQ